MECREAQLSGRVQKPRILSREPPKKERKKNLCYSDSPLAGTQHATPTV